MKEHILLVDDDPAILHLFGLILEKAGYVVSQAKDGEEALKWILEKRENGESYDMLVTDIQMPRMNGIDLIQRLNQYAMDLPIIVMSSVRNDRWMHKLLNNGCSDFIVKPIKAQDLVKRIQIVFAKARTGKPVRKKKTSEADPTYPRANNSSLRPDS